MNIVFTGKMEQTRSLETQKFKNMGLNVQKAITKKTDYLIKGDAPGYNKLNKAENYNIPIISEKKFFEILEEEYPEYYL